MPKYRSDEDTLLVETLFKDDEVWLVVEGYYVVGLTEGGRLRRPGCVGVEGLLRNEKGQVLFEDEDGEASAD